MPDTFFFILEPSPTLHFLSVSTTVTHKRLTCSRMSVVLRHGPLPSLAWKPVRQWSKVVITCSLFAPSLARGRCVWGEGEGGDEETKIPRWRRLGEGRGGRDGSRATWVKIKAI